MFARKKLPTTAVLAYAFGLRRRQNGALSASDIQREIAKDIIQNQLGVMGENLQMAEKVMTWANEQTNPPPRDLAYEELDIAVVLIGDYEKSKDTQTATPTVGDFPIPAGKRGMLKARILSIRERDKSGEQIFANGKSWNTTSHIKMEVSEPSGDDRTWMVIWYATGGKQALKEFWNAYHSGKALMVMATVREVQDTQSVRHRPVNLTRVRTASVSQLADFQKRQEKLAVAKSA